MNKKLQREAHGPSWLEVILGAALSVVLGIALAAAFLIFKPVSIVKELPKEPAPGTIYFIEGSRNSSVARQATAKQQAFLQGGSVALTEAELNSLLGASPARPAAGEAAGESGLAPEALNFRIRDGVLQVGVPVRMRMMGLEQRIVVQARGGFEKRGEVFVFEPDEFYLGSCPLQRLPVIEGVLMKRIVAAANVPEDVAAAWRNLTDATIDGSTLQLTSG